jgi:hypothetical protein
MYRVQFPVTPFIHYFRSKWMIEKAATAEDQKPTVRADDCFFIAGAANIASLLFSK